MDNIKKNQRNCYCGSAKLKKPFFNNPDATQDIPEGYCGICEVCGKPGHIRPHPGAVPYTGEWCDFHYRLLSILHPTTKIGCFLWIVLIAIIGFLLYFAIRRVIISRI
ncbi:MAG: hypothetical protein Q8O30_01535 [Candidatus Omnitrophota bacterium]|nr:hypothetical protein [Candidatus Omnitrophota bacterium]